jgi:hypothetical protein
MAAWAVLQRTNMHAGPSNTRHQQDYHLAATHASTATQYCSPKLITAHASAITQAVPPAPSRLVATSTHATDQPRPDAPTSFPGDQHHISMPPGAHHSTVMHISEIIVTAARSSHPRQPQHSTHTARSSCSFVHCCVTLQNTAQVTCHAVGLQQPQLGAAPAPTRPPQPFTATLGPQIGCPHSCSSLAACSYSLTSHRCWVAPCP